MTKTDGIAAALSEAMERATPGPWRKCGGFTAKYCAITAPHEYIVFGMADYKEDREGNGSEIKAPGYDQQQSNADYIALANPANLRAILDEREASETENARLRKALESISGMATDYANATVRRMAAVARAALTTKEGPA